MLTKEQILAKLNRNRKGIKAYGVKRLILFGSYATDKPDISSDIDFMVEFEKGRGGYRDYMGLLILLEDTFGKEVDLVKPSLLREELRESILGAEQYAAQI